MGRHPELRPASNRIVMGTETKRRHVAAAVLVRQRQNHGNGSITVKIKFIQTACVSIGLPSWLTKSCRDSTMLSSYQSI
jgi:hypothetical protein